MDRLPPFTHVLFYYILLYSIPRAPAGGLRPNVTFGLYRRSADQGNVASLLAIGDAYLAGEGVRQDWVRSAAVYYEVRLWSYVYGHER